MCLIIQGDFAGWNRGGFFTIAEGKGYLYIVQMPAFDKTQGAVNRFKIESLPGVSRPPVGPFEKELQLCFSQNCLHRAYFLGAEVAESLQIQ